MADHTEGQSGKKTRRATKGHSPGEATPSLLATAPASKGQDLATLRNAVVDAAGVGAGLWFSYLFVLLYLLIAAGSITHRDLLYQNPVKLPFLGVDLPLVGFFVLGPLLFLIAHAYVLLHFVLFAGKVGLFHAELNAQVGDEATRARLRRELPVNVFVQFLAGPREVRQGAIGLMLRMIAQISLVVGPVALLVFFQLQFLPYHHSGVTWWHRLAVVGDLALLWILWPSVERGKITRLGWRDSRISAVKGSALVSILVLVCVFSVATFPGEWLDSHLPSVRFVPTWPSLALPIASNSQETGSRVTEVCGEELEASQDPATSGASGSAASPVFSIKWTSVHDLFVGGCVDPISRKATTIWSNRLILPNLDAIDRTRFDTDAKIDAAGETLVLRGRRLDGAIFIGGTFRKVDFTGAQLRGARFDNADLREAKFDCAVPPNDRRGGPRGCADLRGASFESARLQLASFEGAHLQGAYFVDAEMQGSCLRYAWLHGADLGGAKLDAVNFDFAHMQVVDLSRASLRGVSLRNTELHAANLGGVNLEGASLIGTQLLGASFSNVRLDAALFDRVRVWQSDFEGASPSIGRPRIVAVNFKSEYRPVPLEEGGLGSCGEKSALCPWSKESFAALKMLTVESIPAGKRRDRVVGDIGILEPKVAERDAAKSLWTDLGTKSPAEKTYEAALADKLTDLGCDSETGSIAIRALLRDEFFVYRFSPFGSPYPASVARGWLDEAQCRGARALSETDKEKLRRLAKRPDPEPVVSSSDE